MGNPTRRPLPPPITVHQEAAAQAQHRVAGLLEAAGAAPAETQRLIAVTGAGAVEAAHAEGMEQEADVRPGRSDPFDGGWRGAVEAVTGWPAHIADRTVRRAQAVAEPSGCACPRQAAARAGR
ncbi:hypothetical protein [Streptomyces sp. Ag109_O5-10]|uniref:hypothetical protein n=1 Tax=Streptomyces sp. Ag109_O5-10 TaxID=1855349 RepID=UPI0008985B73|nr:hypothetical protein [Streptomyces sp. Ag109_O5-10]SED61894.1 hypothetical protein SAMN05216533_0105 [Streptomyces sp. Ag109_O5-10]